LITTPSSGPPSPTPDWFARALAVIGAGTAIAAGVIRWFSRIAAESRRRAVTDWMTSSEGEMVLETIVRRIIDRLKHKEKLHE
jgi:hypothetical protein